MNWKEILKIGEDVDWNEEDSKSIGDDVNWEDAENKLKLAKNKYDKLKVWFEDSEWESKQMEHAFKGVLLDMNFAILQDNIKGATIAFKKLKNILMARPDYETLRMD
tara:strand:- start:26 stop:346 length:321 start_codon:yes stop_codon:yes gene_type:complete